MKFEDFQKRFDETFDWGKFEKSLAERDAEYARKRTENISHLLPCPCCGGRAVRAEDSGNGLTITWGAIECEDCKLKTEGIWGELNAEDVWQRRVNK